MNLKIEKDEEGRERGKLKGQRSSSALSHIKAHSF